MTTTQTRDQLSYQRDLAREEVKSLKAENEELKKQNDECEEWKEEQMDWDYIHKERECELLREEIEELKEENEKLHEESIQFQKEVKALEEVHIIFTNQKATIIEGYEIQQKELAEIKSQNIQNCSTNKKLRDILDKMECYECEHCVNWRGVYVEERYENGKIKKWCCESCMYELTEIQNL